MDINKEEQRISLSIKDAVDSNTSRESEPERIEKDEKNNSGVGVNIGEVFGDLLTRAEQK